MRTNPRKNRRRASIFLLILSMFSLGFMTDAFSSPIELGYYGNEVGTSLSAWKQFGVFQIVPEPTTILLLGLGLGMMGLAVAIWKFKN